VTRGDDGRWVVNDERGAVFVDPGRPISSATMAVHHIIDADVAGAAFWKDAAPPILKPADGVLALAAHRAAFEQRYCTPQLSGGARWICTWKCALRLWPALPGFSNQMLRYERMPEGLNRELGLPAHRAMPDAYVTAHHLRDMLNQASIEQLLTWSAEPGLLPRVTDRTGSRQVLGAPGRRGAHRLLKGSRHGRPLQRGNRATAQRRASRSRLAAPDAAEPALRSNTHLRVRRVSLANATETGLGFAMRDQSPLISPVPGRSTSSCPGRRRSRPPPAARDGASPLLPPDRRRRSPKRG
jgi:exodeoxyribonuclease X